ncbi:MAG: DUF2235 domain-containing protein, partial [Gammaproteobacteria bacterium]|nr:DUF2235 domain-containing protein [Gammaproteobacteria bacterium]
MRHFVICTDGTWNTPDQTDRGRVVPSNVVKISRALAGHNTAGVEQLLYYDRGVGTQGGWDAIKGGAFGIGLSDNVIEAYQVLGHHYQEGDRLFLFGFSRGAYTARSLAGLIGLCGIPDPGKGDVHSLVKKAWAIYRESDPGRRQQLAAAHVQACSVMTSSGMANEIWFIGVWDTVGALGIPLKPLNWLGRQRTRFHDVRLGAHIRHAYHAIAIDERRRPFKPALWERGVADGEAGQSQPQEVQQVWFTGVHSNIGGGYVDTGLSDRAFLWMSAKARTKGLGFRADYMSRRIDPNYHGELRNSMHLGYKMLLPCERPVGGGSHILGERIHYSVAARLRHPTELAYRDLHRGSSLDQALKSDLPAIEPGMPEELNFHSEQIG